ncbi:MAG: hypothetical protein SFU83_11675 [Meiothermus sp.]|nr:hypothetical protein [Meiothermus sp.]
MITHSLEQLKQSNLILLEELGEHCRDYLAALEAWQKDTSDQELRGTLEAAALQLKFHMDALTPSLELEDELSDGD